MGDRMLAGYETVGAWEPIQLYAGEADTVTTQEVVKAGQVLGKLNTRGDTYRFAVVALVAGKLVAYDPTNSDNPDDYATGTLTLSTAVPVAGDKLTINGHDVVFVADADPDDLEATIGATLNASAANMAKAINAHRDEFGVDGGVIASAAGAVVTVKSPGVAGNAVTLAKTFATGANGTVSGATLAGGTDADAGIGGAAEPYGILPHAIDTSATGYNADTDSPVFVGGVFNFEALDLPDGTSYAEIKAAFARTNIVIQKLY